MIYTVTIYYCIYIVTFLYKQKKCPHYDDLKLKDRIPFSVSDIGILNILYMFNTVTTLRELSNVQTISTLHNVVGQGSIVRALCSVCIGHC